MLAAEAVAKLEDPTLPIGEVLEGLAEGLLGEDLGSPLVRGLSALVGDELAELRLLLVADRLLERDRGLGGALDGVDFLRIDPRDLGDLLGGGLAAPLPGGLAPGAADLFLLFSDMDRGPGGGRLVGQ